MMNKLLTVFVVTSLAGACSKGDDKAKASPQTGDRRDIAVTEDGIEPQNVTVPSGKPITLVFTRKSDKTCAREVIIPIGDQKIERKLPLNEAVAIEVTFPKAGKITYACGMDMIKGVVTVE